MPVSEYADAMSRLSSTQIANALEQMATDALEFSVRFEALGHQPRPISSTATPTWELVIADMRERDHIGQAKYGTPLQPNNGRDSLVDAYEEALDLAVYLRNAIEERKE